jgi:hypothetical protein
VTDKRQEAATIRNMATGSRRGTWKRTILLLWLTLARSYALDFLSDLPVSNDLAQSLQNIDFSTVTKPLALQYDIFRGRSALRDLPQVDRQLLRLPDLSKTAVAILLLLRGLGDAAHEVLLGVTLENLVEAEYAASRPGTDWAKQHPLSAEDDMLHYILHRCEGCEIGEGNHTGFENAAYWAAGGPKQHSLQPKHAVSSAMFQYAKQHAPHCIRSGVLARLVTRTYAKVIAGGGSHKRTVSVANNSWDPFRFLDLCRNRPEGCLPAMAREIDMLQEIEVRLLLRYELLRKLQEQLGGNIVTDRSLLDGIQST